MKDIALPAAGTNTQAFRNSVLPIRTPLFHSVPALNGWGAEEVDMIRHYQPAAHQPCAGVDTPNIGEGASRFRIRQPVAAVLCANGAKENGAAIRRFKDKA